MNYIALCNELARKGIHFVEPNPYVGAVIVKGGNIISTGYHEKYGENHAERNAILNAKVPLDGATLFCNLEPCSHQGKTPPCVDLIIKSGITKVVIGARDPSSKTKGLGIKKLQDHGIKVTLLQDKESLETNKTFLSKYPEVTIKVATSLDGKIATSTYDSYGISSKDSLHYVQKLRSTIDGILVGVNTVIKDNPKLTSRELPNNSLHRFIIDPDLLTPLHSYVVTTANRFPTTIFTSSKDRVPSFKHKAVNIIVLPQGFTSRDVLHEIELLNIKKLLIEGGGFTNFSFLKEGLVDKYIQVLSPRIIGGATAISSFEGEGFTKISNSTQVQLNTIETVGKDILLKGDVLCSQE